MKAGAGSGRLQRVRIHLAHYGDNQGFVGRTHDPVAARVQEIHEARPGGAGWKLFVEHLIDLLQARIGSVRAVLAARGGAQKEKKDKSQR